ncbi:MAG: PIG-L family deacetylase [Rhodothermaceae bacterium]|nr:PIG-L family deacetylase [Rhodothermaceae bacterium]
MLRLLTTFCLASLLCAPATIAQEQALNSTLSTEGGPLLDVDRGSTGLWQQLLKLSTTASALHTVAHPDDEHAGLLTYLSRGTGARVSLISINRGEAGANAIGPELFDGLGLIRTEELRLAGRYYGLDGLYFSSAVDYGYSKTLEESLKSWDVERVLSDMVRVIRMDRPVVVISRFHGSLRDGHGNHVAVGQITPDAVAAAANPERFPEQITDEGLRPWKVRKLYRGGVRENEPWNMNFDAGQHSPWLGESYYNFGMYGLSLQRSQTSGRTRTTLGPVPYYYERLSEPGAEAESSFFDGLNVTLAGLFELTGEAPPEGGATLLDEIAAHVHDALMAARPGHPDAVVGDLTAGLAKTRELLELLPEDSDSAFMLRIKEEQFQHAIATAVGLAFTATAQPTGTPPVSSFWQAPSTMGPVVRGQSFEIDARLSIPTDITADAVTMTLKDPTGLSREDWQISSEVRQSTPYHQVVFAATVPNDAAYARPYFFRNSVKENHFQWRDPRWKHQPTRPASLQATASLNIMGVPVHLVRDVQTREANLPYGYVMRKLQVMPALAVNVSPAHRIVIPQASGSQFTVSAEIINNVPGGTVGSLDLELPEGWTATPSSHDLTFAQAGERQLFAFEVHVPDLESGHVFNVRAVAHVGEATISEGYQVIRHSHMETRYLFRDATTQVTGLQADITPDLNVGYVMGVGDEVPSAIQQLGAAVTLLQEADLASGTLSEFDAIVIGTRAYAVRQDLLTNNRRLMEYAHAGGNLIVLYQTQEFVPDQMAPISAQLPRGAEEVSEEDAAVTILAPDHAVLAGPNPITEADFDGWVEQRGSKFFTEWDDAYTPLIEMNDTGQAPQRGAFLVADYGQGHYTYCALALHRQVPYSVAGAYRLLANLLSM